MKCETDVGVYRCLQSETRSFQLLAGISEKYELERRDILKSDPLPTAEAVYALLCGTEQGIRSNLVVQLDNEASGMVVKGFRPLRSGQPKNGSGASYREKIDKSKLKCTHCGMNKHTKENYFRLVGYPEWWEDNHKPLKDNRGKASIAVGNSVAIGTTTDGDGDMAMAARVSGIRRGIENEREQTAAVFNFEGTGSGQTRYLYKNLSWIFDCGATDTRTYEASDICELSKPTKTHVQTTSREITPVMGAGTVVISPTLRISNCLYVPALSHKLLSISHVTKELNCTVLMHPTFWLLQDIRTEAIIRRGTEHRGLYYVDEITQKGMVMLATGTASQATWLWHH
ncbi:hypothetical protein C2S51_015477 [Perilla frutescens var. frutescens]|nr:hypothetical protein C2S51_015477 [Perilla frutescens var. frutescens]